MRALAAKDQPIADSVRALVVLLAVFAAAPSAAAEESPIATDESNGGSLRLEIKDLKREEGGFLMLRFRVVPKDSMTGEFDLWVKKVELLDVAGRRKYLVVHDDSVTTDCFCSRPLISVGHNDGAVNAWAKFGAPPSTVQKVTILVPGFEPVDNVPIAGP
jgi:hypothetical protein